MPPRRRRESGKESEPKKLPESNENWTVVAPEDFDAVVIPYVNKFFPDEEQSTEPNETEPRALIDPANPTSEDPPRAQFESDRSEDEENDDESAAADYGVAKGDADLPPAVSSDTSISKSSNTRGRARSSNGGEGEKVQRRIRGKENLDRIREMEQTSEYTYTLPNGSRIECANGYEYVQVEQTAKPYVEKQERIPSNRWIDVVNLLQAKLNLDRIQKKLTDIEKRQSRVMERGKEDEIEEFEIKWGSSLVGLTRQWKDFQQTVNEIRKNLDVLKSDEAQKAETMDEFIQRNHEETIDFANDHLGEFSWLTTCPSVNCVHYKKPFLVLQQSPHFAYDFSASPYIIWNWKVFYLTQKFYTPKEQWTDAHKKLDSPGLSFGDAAEILMISEIGWVAAIYEKQALGLVEFPIDTELLINSPKLLAAYLKAERRPGDPVVPSTAATTAPMPV